MMRKFFTVIFAFFVVLPNLMYATGNPGREEAKIDQVYSQFGLTGKGTIVVMIDRGIDYTHPDFLDANGQTRLAYLFDLIDDSGANASNNTYGRGTIYTAADINASLQAGTTLSTDRHGHGTATTSIACGNGSAVDGNEFRGVAYEATIISVKVTQDGFPAFGNQPGEAGAFDPSDIPVALQFVADKLEELGMPGVTLINLGSVGGPTDGTSTICRAMDDFVARGHTLVCGVGDDGGADNFASAAVPLGNSNEIQINKGTAGVVRLDLWYSESDRFSVEIERPNGQKLGPFAAPSGPDGFDDRNFTDIRYFHRGANTEFFGATSNRRELLIDFSGATGVYKVILTATAAEVSASYAATLNPATYASPNRFLTNPVAGHSVADYTSAFNIISPADYVVKNEWFDLSGTFRDFTGQGEDGEIWIGSSVGPSHDGRLVTDFAAPGEILFGAYSPNTWYSNFQSSLVQGGEGKYGIQNAVSAAAPLSMGVIALMLELKPDLTPAEIKDILQQTARQDNNTGSVPNNTWGYGKLDALAAVQAVNSLVPTNDPATTQAHLKLFPNPTIGQLIFQLTQEKVSADEVMVTNYLGEVVYRLNATEIERGQFNLPAKMVNGVYQLVAVGKGWRAASRFVKL